jgi:DNA-binding MarR family transcriptional regulator
MGDGVDEILQQWADARPDLDTSPMGVFGRLSRAARLADACLQRSFSQHDLDAASFDVLATLRRSGPPFRLTPTQLQRSSMVTSSAIAQRLNRLESRGLVIREPNAEDGRVIDVGLTDEGFQLIEESLPDHLRNERQLLARLSISQRKELASLLSQLFNSMENG